MLAPNDVWCADFKGQFKTGNGIYCYPLTVTDGFSRYLLGCQGLLSTSVVDSKPVFTRLFREFGLPKRIPTDNGVPFASAHAIYGLSKLSVWWLRLGIQIERSKPGHPQDNGRHERMHLTLKKDATKPAAANVLQQQARFDTFVERFNLERPHQALAMKVPADVYARSPRVYRGLDELTYPFHDQTVTVTHCGRLCFKGRKVNLSQVFAGQNVGAHLRARVVETLRSWRLCTRRESRRSRATRVECACANGRRLRCSWGRCRCSGTTTSTTRAC